MAAADGSAADIAIADQIGSKVPAIVNANIGYASGTTDAGQPWYQDGSFTFLSNGKLNAESLRDFSVRAMVEQAVKTKALVSLYYGKAPKYTYYDGHSQGGRQGMKIMQEYPELYDGYLIAQPAPNIAKFGTSGLYPQIVMKTELGYTAINKDEAKAFAAKVAAANVRAVAACDTAGLGFLLDPFACNYNPARDAAALCTGAAGDGVTGSNADAATCLSAKEATALNKIWYGATPDGSFDAAQTPDSRSGKSLGAKQVWWTFTRGTAIGGQITSAGTDNVAQALQDVSYAADASATSAIPITNASTPSATNGSNSIMPGWPMPSPRTSRCSRRCSATSSPTRPILRNCATSAARWWSGPALPTTRSRRPATSTIMSAWSPRWAATPRWRSSCGCIWCRAWRTASQGRAYTVGGKNDTVPLPKLPGNANQTPTREQDQFFTALVDWVEKGDSPRRHPADLARQEHQLSRSASIRCTRHGTAAGR